MKAKVNWTQVLFIIGIVALLIGVIDPIEGSLVIAAGSVFIALSSFFSRGRYHKIFITSAIMIVLGVISIFYASSLGGFDPRRDWWWFIFILPYPLGWLISIITLVVIAVKKLNARRNIQ